MSKKQVAALQDEVAAGPAEEVKTEIQVGAPTEEIKTEEAVVEPTADDYLKMSEQVLITKFGNKSGAIRALGAMGHKCGPISRALNISFQHARNVLSKPLKRQIAAERAAAAAVQQQA